MIRVKVLRPTNAGRGGTWGVGELVELPDALAGSLIARGRAVAVLGEPEEDGGGAPVPESRDPVPVSHDPAPTRRRKR